MYKALPLLILLSCVSLLSAQESPPRVGLIPLINQTNDSDQDLIKDTIDSTLETSFQFLERYETEAIPGINPYSSFEDSIRYLISHNLDYSVYGRVFYADEGSSQVEIVVFDLIEKKELLRLNREMENVFTIFSIADELVGEVINSFSSIHIGFGSLELHNNGEHGTYTVFLDGRPVGRRLEEIRALPLGSHHLAIYQERIFERHTLVDRDITIAEGQTLKVEFSIPLLTNSEAKVIEEKEEFIRRNWYVQEQQPALLETLAELYTLLENPDYAPALMRRQVKYILWEEIYRDRGEIPGVTQPRRPSFAHWLVALEGGGYLLQGDAARVFNNGSDVRLSGGRGWIFPWGDLSLLGHLGLKTSETVNDATLPYSLTTLPVSLGVSVRSGFRRPFFLGAELFLGGALHQLQYKREADKDTSFSFSSYLGGSLQAGYFLNKGTAVRTFVRGDLSLFEGTSPFGITVGGGITLFVRSF